MAGRLFLDLNREQFVGFPNLPTEGSSGHRGVATSSSIPAAPPDNTNTPQTASAGASYLGPQNIPISPDTPHTPTPGDDSYQAATGGVLAVMQLQVVGNEQGHQLFMNLDDGSPNSPGSSFSYFNGAGLVDVPLASGALGDGFHGEGIACSPQDCTTLECPAATPTPVDADGDGVPNANDNCPAWPNPSQNLPPWPVGQDDADCDGFNLHCGANAWPADINNDTFSDISDVSALTGVFGSAVPPAPARYNIAPDPPDGFVDISDVARMVAFFGRGCS
ncbi:MAG: hypothetical protein E6J43_00490 [Chloroflexi bacterium]|nr:MAG: hypothetical protein E6J43_00490 [Chloroflexota bacterium]